MNSLVDGSVANIGREGPSSSTGGARWCVCRTCAKLALMSKLGAGSFAASAALFLAKAILELVIGPPPSSGAKIRASQNTEGSLLAESDPTRRSTPHCGDRS
jgi:hypothetical protein